MGIELDADEVFRMAEQVERDATAFYTQAASASVDPQCRRVLLNLASMENDHEQIFSAMRDQLAGRAWPPGGLAAPGAEHWPSVADLLVSGVRDDLAGRFSERQTGEQILKKAIDFEKDSIVFFVGLKGMLSDPADRQKVDEIIKEELGHILTLTGTLASPRPGN